MQCLVVYNSVYQPNLILIRPNSHCCESNNGYFFFKGKKLSKKNLGNLFIVAAPSGAGKTSLVKALVQMVGDLEISISYTTRPPRPGEIDGVDYFFIEEPKFQEMIQNDQFLEYATVYGYHYGTAQEYVLNRLSEGKDILLEIDWQGALQVKKKFPEVISVFILPPSIAVLRDRLYRRKQDEEQVIRNRLSKAQEEIAYYQHFDYVIVNDSFEEALENLACVVRTQRLHCAYQARKLYELLAELLQTE
jgi:guanylate kinase